MRFFRLYWIPDGMDASEGAYVRDRFEDLLAHSGARERSAKRAASCGEDLGTVSRTKCARRSRSFGILSYRVLYFEQDRTAVSDLPREYPARRLVSATTHDLPTLAGFWMGRDIEARRAARACSRRCRVSRMLADRAAEKQKLLDLLVHLQLLPDWFPRNARDVPELTGELHNAVDRLSRVHALEADGC